jgi:hypothetical protein
MTEKVKALRLALQQGGVLDPLLRPPEDTSSRCRVCRRGFGFLDRGEQCLLCGRKVCSSCVRSHVLPEASLRLCVECGARLRQVELNETLERWRAAAGREGLGALEASLERARRQAQEEAQRVRMLVTLGADQISLEQWQEAQFALQQLARHISTLETGARSLAAQQQPSPQAAQRGLSAQARVARNLQAALVASLQSLKPEARLLEEELRVLPRPPPDRPPGRLPSLAVAETAQSRAREEDETAAVAARAGGGLESEDGPSITAVEPAVAPVEGGGDVLVSGRNFAKGLRALVDGRPCSRVDFLSSTAVRLRLPAMPAPGPRQLLIVNPSGQRAILDGVLLFLDFNELKDPEPVPFLHTHEPEPTEPEPEPMPQPESKPEPVPVAIPAPTTNPSPPSTTTTTTKPVEPWRRWGRPS